MFDCTGFILGFDPGGQGKRGGKGNFGWSICKEVDGCLQPPCKTGLARDAQGRTSPGTPGSPG